ncbi:hypothetical protein FOS14_22145 [Skermania sp. ID1734]|uniref:hypothetical protein n=1 Tax=Skermania sp. ID1734 TaxID=2597516 RepID=UPI00117C6E02|nr:hypothetical protein [Skermania sp. ID1734]TSD93766.1 hypothetical protein FOS14_22145 [Skermania sp. ID1734]
MNARHSIRALPTTSALVMIAVLAMVTVHVGAAAFLIRHWGWSLALPAGLVAAKLLVLGATYVIRRRRRRART